jgi:hypothetical protein
MRGEMKKGFYVFVLKEWFSPRETQPVSGERLEKRSHSFDRERIRKGCFMVREVNVADVGRVEGCWCITVLTSKITS